MKYYHNLANDDASDNPLYEQGFDANPLYTEDRVAPSPEVSSSLGDSDASDNPLYGDNEGAKNPLFDTHAAPSVADDDAADNPLYGGNDNAKNPLFDTHAAPSLADDDAADNPLYGGNDDGKNPLFDKHEAFLLGDSDAADNPLYGSLALEDVLSFHEPLVTDDAGHQPVETAPAAQDVSLAAAAFDHTPAVDFAAHETGNSHLI